MCGWVAVVAAVVRCVNILWVRQLVIVCVCHSSSVRVVAACAPTTVFSNSMAAAVPQMEWGLLLEEPQRMAYYRPNRASSRPWPLVHTFTDLYHTISYHQRSGSNGATVVDGQGNYQGMYVW